MKILSKIRMLKFAIYKFLGKFIPYFKKRLEMAFERIKEDINDKLIEILDNNYIGKIISINAIDYCPETKHSIESVKRSNEVITSYITDNGITQNSSIIDNKFRVLNFNSVKYNILLSYDFENVPEKIEVLVEYADNNIFYYKKVKIGERENNYAEDFFKIIEENKQILIRHFDNTISLMQLFVKKENLSN